MLILVTTGFSNNANAQYSIITAGDGTSVKFEGVGKVPLDNNTYPRITCLVTQQGQTMTIVN
jgi:hypothetical protein